MLVPDSYEKPKDNGKYLHNGQPIEPPAQPGKEFLKDGNPNKPITHHKGYMQNGVPTTKPVLPGNMHGKG